MDQGKTNGGIPPGFFFGGYLVASGAKCVCLMYTALLTK